jgi:hypothetical protein
MEKIEAIKEFVLEEEPISCNKFHNTASILSCTRR